MLSLSTFTAGTHSISAIYSGSPGLGFSASPVLQQVVQGSVVVFSPASLTFDYPTVGTTSPPQSLALMNTGNIALAITSIGITGTDSGDFAQTNTCGTSVPAGGGCNIAVTITPKAAGTRNAAVSVADSAPHSPQTAALVANTTDFTLSSASPATQTVTPGQAANYSLTVEPASGFNQTVSFSCSGEPAESTCTVSPNAVTMNGSNPITVDVAVVTKGSAVALGRPVGGPPAGNPFAAWLTWPGLVGIVLMSGTVTHSRWRLRLLYALGFTCLLAITLTMPACGGGNGSGGGTGTATGTYDLTVTGTFTSGSTTVIHKTNLTLVVQ